MRKNIFYCTLSIVMVALITTTTLGQKAAGKFKVFISVDMEGISGVVDWSDVGGTEGDYQYFRKIMTKEVNAAVEGALDAGATEILIRDSHNTARNILIDELNPEATLLRGWVGGPLVMMDGIDETFDAVIFIGYHAKAGTPDAVLKHTMQKNIMDVKINGMSQPESGINGIIAGYYNVPVVFVSGDKAICDYVKSSLGTVETVAVKEGMGAAALCIHPRKARMLIKEGVKKALTNFNNYSPYKIKSPYTIEIIYKDEEKAYKAALWPNAKRTGDWTVTFTSSELLNIFTFLRLNW